jgi:hypothetical protein
MGKPGAEKVDWVKERREIEASGIRLINKDHSLVDRLPLELCRKFEQLVAEGKKPNVFRNPGGLCVRAGIGQASHSADNGSSGQASSAAGGNGADSTSSAGSNGSANAENSTAEAPGPDGRERVKPGSLLGEAWYFGDPMPEQAPMLVPYFVPACGFGYLGGQWGTFKTFILNDLAVAVASGGTFAGQQVSQRGVVIQIELEGSNNEARMLAAATSRFCQHERLPIVHFKKEPPKILLNAQPNPTFREWARQIAEYSRAVAVQFDLPLALITIDPQGRFAGFRDENSSSEGQAVNDAFTYLVQLVGCAVLISDHLGKDPSAGLRGTSAKETNPLFLLCTSEHAAARPLSRHQAHRTAADHRRRHTAHDQRCRRLHDCAAHAPRDEAGVAARRAADHPARARGGDHAAIEPRAVHGCHARSRKNLGATPRFGKPARASEVACMRRKMITTRRTSRRAVLAKQNLKLQTVYNYL